MREHQFAQEIYEFCYWFFSYFVAFLIFIHRLSACRKELKAILIAIEEPSINLHENLFPPRLPLDQTFHKFKV